jgi:Methylamine utilisation protein MauE/AhpC/TSA family
MDVALLFARVALALVLSAASLGKLRDRAGARDAIVGFGVAPALAPALAIVVPVAELAIAVLLIPVATAAWAAAAALLLLAAFTGAILLNLLRGRTPACNCFGVASRQPIGARTVVRNGVLMALAAFVAVAGWNDAGEGLLEWFSGLSTPVIAGILLAGAFAISVGLFAWLGRTSVEADGEEDDDDDEEDFDGAPSALAVGSTAPAFVAEDLDGHAVGLESLRRPGVPTLLVFADPNCGSCVALLPEVARWQRDLAGDLTVVVVAEGEADAVRAETDAHGLADVVVQREGQVSGAYRMGGTPSAIVVGADGRIAVEEAEGAEEIDLLVRRERWRVPTEREG